MAVSRRIARSGGERPATWVTRSAGNRSVIALWLGGAAFAGAALSPAFAQFDQIPLHFAWSMLFPMIAAMAFGRANGLLAAIAGPVLIPFLLWQGAGWGSASFSLTCFLWLGWIGHCVERRKQTAALWNHPAVAPLPLLLLTPLLYLAVMPALLHLNSLSPWHERTVDHLSALSILAIAVKQVASFCFALLGARCLLKLPAVRRLVGLTTPPSFRFNGTILAATLALLMALSVTMVALDTLLIGGSDLTAVLQSPYELVGLVFVALLLLAGSLLCCRFIEQQIATTDHLRHVESELRFSEERFELAMQAANDGLIDWAPQQQRLYLSPRWRSVLGYRDSEIPLRPVQWASLLHPDDRQPAMTTLQRALDGDETRVEIEFRALHFDGGYRHIKARAMILRDAQQRPSRVIGTQRDVTEAVEAARRQKQAEAVFNTTLEGVVVADEGGLIVAANPALTSLSGYSETQLLGQPLAFLSADGGTSLGTETIPSDSDHWKGSVWIRQQSGEILPQWLTLSVVRDNHGKPINYVGIYTDISALRKNAAQMEFLAHHDPLTNLPNRLLLKSRLIHALDMVKRRHGRGAVLFLDLDHFKQVNDSLGHRYGDELLQQLVQRLRNRLRESDTLARLGGDEFVAILEDVTGPNDAAVVAANLIEQAGLPFQLSGGHEVQVGCSVGISLFPEDSQDSDELLHNADLALYQAKEAGRSRYNFYNREDATNSQRRLDSNQALNVALTSGGLMLYFQPVVSLVDGRVQGSEALLRWREPDGRLLTPDKFMPMAENTALMARLGDWVLREACRTMRSWIDDGLDVTSMTVNLSLHQFKMPDLPQRIDVALKESGLEPHRLELDITEAAMMPGGDDPLARLRDLKSLGLTLALDDFGTGYSCFAKLGQYPVDKIKVDTRFVHEIDESFGGTAAAIVAMAKLLQIPVQAEGIETERQRELLLRSQCVAGQGYLFSHPMPEDDFRAWCGNNRIH